MTIAIDLCVGWVRVGECPGATFAGVARHLAAGEWTLSGEVDGVELQGAYTLADIDTIRIVEDRSIVFAGLVKPVDTGVGGLEVVDTGQGQRFTLAGPDLWEIMHGRVCYPTPSTEPPWANSFDERTGVASTVAAAYINANLGAAALAARQYPGVAIGAATVGASGSWSARLQPLDELVQRICREGGITCRLSVGFDGALSVTFAVPLDRTTTTILSDQGDLVNIRQRRTQAKSTYVVAGGQGLLNARAFRTAGTATGAARRERFIDQSALSTTTELQQSATANLAADGADWSINADLSTGAAQRLTVGLDYRVGDTVAVEIDNVRYPVTVAAVTYVITPTDQAIRPVLGEAAPDLLGGLLLDVADLQSRFDTNIA